ncbi:hypothetical protein EQH57_0482 [Dictyocoela roeselum]|nr:hypothetical protein EQH57_0482 [Dictyocoela roeselum]
MRINLTLNIIVSSRGRPKIAYEGYFYNHKQDLEKKRYGDAITGGYSSLLKTNLESDLLEVGVHNHLKDDLKFNKVLLQQKIKFRSLDTKESSRNVVLGVLKENRHLQIPLNIRKLNSLVNITRKINDYTVI